MTQQGHLEAIWVKRFKRGPMDPQSEATMVEGRGIEQVMIVVTRYFGGIKLGIGGLVRAYGGCAAKCLDRADIVET